MARVFAVYARFIVEAADEAEALALVTDPDQGLPEMDEAWIESEYEAND